jgi:hypothetical protein
MSRIDETILPHTEEDARWRWPIACATILVASIVLWGLIGLAAHQLGLI